MASGDKVKLIIEDRANEKGEGGPFGLTDNNLTRIITKCLREFNMHEPRTIVTLQLDADIVDSEFTLPATWREEFDYIVEIEFPVGQPLKKVLRPGIDYYIVETTTNVHVIHFLAQLGDDWRLDTKQRWTLDTAEADEIALEKLGLLSASRVASAKSTKYSDTEETTLLADTVNRKSTGETWRSIAKDLMEEYEELIKPPTERAAAGQNFEMVDLASGPFGTRRNRRLVHGPFRHPK